MCSPAPASGGPTPATAASIPDGFTLRSGVTAVADAGCAGWRNFEDFKKRIIDRARTRVFVFLNIVGNGMRGVGIEQDLEDMQAKPTAEMALRHKGVIVGIKTAHYMGPDFTPVERAVEAGTIADIPVMVDFGRALPTEVARRAADEEAPAGRYLHARLFRAAGRARPLGPRQSRPVEGRKRGVLFDVGHGGGELHLAGRRADHPGGLPPRLDLDRPARRQRRTPA